MKISVALVFCDNSELYLNMIDSINRHICPFYETEIILIDNRKDKSEQLNIPENVIYNNSAKSVLHAWQLCYALATGDFVWVVDDDDLIIGFIDNMDSIKSDILISVINEDEKRCLPPSLQNYQPFSRILCRETVNKLLDFINDNLICDEWYNSPCISCDVIYNIIYNEIASYYVTLEVPIYWFNKGRTDFKTDKDINEIKIKNKYQNVESTIHIIDLLIKSCNRNTEYIKQFRESIFFVAKRDSEIQPKMLSTLDKKDLDFLGLGIKSV